jgi:hypothetical protein
MRHVPAVASLIIIIAACSSSTEGEECRIEGTYTATGKLESGNCPIDDGAAPVTDTITKLPDGRYRLEIQGTTGACDLDLVGACKLQGKCGLSINDPVTPGDTGTVQYSWTFTPTGFTGFSAVTIPPAKGLPDGCSGTANVTGTRR